MNAAAVITRDPRRLAALCALWQSAEKEVWITLQGVSMTPTILPGSRLRLRCRPADVKVGEVVAYRRGGKLIIHRLIEVRENSDTGARQYVCLGDGCARPDPPVSEEVLVGVIVETRPPGLMGRLRWKTRCLLLNMRRAAVKLRRMVIGGNGKASAR